MPQPGALATGGSSKPKLKISVKQPSAADGHTAPLLSATPGTPATPGASSQPPPSADGIRKMIKIKSMKQSGPPTPGPQTPAPLSATTKAGRQTKPTKKIMEASKRDIDELDDETDHERASKKIKFRKGSAKSGAPMVKFKNSGRPIRRPLGEGYDSEASDREDDPVIEEQFILRMPPGEHCDYVRRAIEENRFDPRNPDRRLPDINIKFFDESSRRAVMMVKGQLFAAVMVDLPTVTETMKTWDRKNFMKSADICQMLLVFKQVRSEEEARHAPPPPMIEPGNRWPHGLTPPMHDCVKRRFAKTISRKEIEDKEAEVDRLLEEDRKAFKTEWRWYDPIETDKSKAVSDLPEEEQDADGEIDDTFTPAAHLPEDELVIDRDMEEELENELENAFNEMDEVAATPGGTQLEGATPMTLAAETPAPAAMEEEESDISEEDEDEDADEDDEEESDEEASEERKAYRATMEIVADLRKQLAAKEAERDRAQLPIMKQRVETFIRSIKQEIQNKLRAIGKDEDEEMEE